MTTPERTSTDGKSATGPDESVQAGISREMVRLYKEQFGRGPTRVRTHFAGPDIVICTLEDTLTPAERNMVQMGAHDRLRETRLFFQYATMDSFVSSVERLTNRHVRAFVSGIDTRVDVSAEVFYLVPADDQLEVAAAQ